MNNYSDAIVTRTGFAILEDAELEAMAAYHIRTDPVTGLCDKHVDAVVALLGAKGES